MDTNTLKVDVWAQNNTFDLLFVTCVRVHPHSLHTHTCTCTFLCMYVYVYMCVQV